MNIKNFLNKHVLTNIRHYWTRSNTKKILSYLVIIGIIFLILFSHYFSRQLMLRPDDVATRNIASRVNAVIVNEEKTEELRQEAAAAVQKIYQEDQEALPGAEQAVEDFFAETGSILNTENGDARQALVDFLSQTIAEINDARSGADIQTWATYLANATSGDLNLMRGMALDVVRDIMDKPITQDTLAADYAEAENIIDSYPYAQEAREIMALAVIQALRPNMVFNPIATERAVQEARNAVEPVQITIKAGEIIVREGVRITSQQISILEQLGMQRTQGYPLPVLGGIIFVLISCWLAVEFLKRHHQEIYNDHMQMLLIGLIFVIILLISRFLSMIEIANLPEVSALIGYLTPVAAASMLLAILLDNRLAYFFTSIIALYVGLLSSGNTLFVAITAFIGGTVGVYMVSRLSQTSDLARAGVYVALANIICIISLTLMGDNITPAILATGILLGAINGILSAVLMIGALPYLESAFSLTSMVKLLELSNPNQPLLKQLLLNTPGTYHHSLMVGNLAETTAESVGANPLLVRVGAYYHDIGKIKRPEYFVENQISCANPHEKIAPALSSLIITSHVKEGVEMAREAKLPQIIIDFIEQHHGTSLTKYFYQRALEEDRENNLNAEAFRYEGPKPQNKDVALVMLADSVEAAVKSLTEPTPENISEMVRRIIWEKMEDKQLEDCDLTFKDLNIIAKSFSKVLAGMYHKRIEYPEFIIKEMEKRSGDHGDIDHQSAK